MARARDALMDTVTDAVTRSFRPAFGVAAALAALAAHPALLVVLGHARPAPDAVGARTRLGRRDRRRSASPALGLLAVELAAGARDVGEFVAEDPCTARPDPYPGDGIDGAVQRIALSTLNGAACELRHDPRAARAVARPEQRLRRRQWDDETLEKALQVGAHRAIDDADDRDTIPGWVGRGPRLRRRPGADRLARRAAAAPRLTSRHVVAGTDGRASRAAATVASVVSSPDIWAGRSAVIPPPASAESILADPRRR